MTNDNMTLRQQLEALLPYEVISDSGTLVDKLEALLQEIAREAVPKKLHKARYIPFGNGKIIEVDSRMAEEPTAPLTAQMLFQIQGYNQAVEDMNKRVSELTQKPPQEDDHA